MDIEKWIAIAPFILIGLAVIVGLSSFFKKKYSDIVIFKYLSNIAIVMTLLFFILYILVFFGYLFLSSILIIYSIFLKLYSLFALSENCNNYLAITTTLLFLAYIPEKVGYYLLKVLEKSTSANYLLSQRYQPVIRYLRIRLWIYFISFVLILISSIETFQGTNFIELIEWIHLKPVIVQSVLTLITLDRFINLLKTELNGIVKETALIFDKVKDTYNEMSTKSDNVS